MRKLNVLELFAGRRCIGRAFEERGHKVLSADWDYQFPNIDFRKDVMELTPEYVRKFFGGEDPDVVWMSPECTTYSVAAISHHRRKHESGNLDPVTDYARVCDKVNMHCHNLVMCLRPKVFFIENPRGAMRNMDFMSGLPRYTICYCQYKDKRQKPTDIWTNHPDPKFKPPCKAGDPCHEAAPRGSRNGTQGLKGHVERSLIPEELCRHIVDISEELFEE